MIRHSRFVSLAVAAGFLLTQVVAQALQLPKIFSDNMVLQREVPVKVWGWADPGDEIKVAFASQTKTAVAGDDGKWTVTLEPLKAADEPAGLTVAAGAERVTIKNVLVGEVWICSGQSNMEWTVASTHNVEETVAAANYPRVRQFKVPHVISTKPQNDLPGSWVVCSPDTVKSFTGVGYHFGLELHSKLGVPVGLVNTSWGGTRIEPWTDPEGFAVSPKLKDISNLVKNADENHRRNVAARLDQIESWVAESRKALKSGAEIPKVPGGLPQHSLNNSRAPTAIYNAMVAPLVPFGIRGAIWYQGESNNGEGMLYYEKMRALTSSWRRLWGQGNFPFLYVQLAPFRYNRPEDLPGIWEAQAAALSIPNTGMAVTTDIGNVSDIHPRNKQEVGRRLSLWALAKTYGQAGLVYSGPLYQSMEIDGSRVILKFSHAKGLKSLDGKPLTWFTLAGSDKKFQPADASIVGETVVVSSEEVSQPVAVRFGWHELAEPNLANGSGLPASPFRTDR